MVLNYIWIAFIVIAFLVALLRVCAYFFRDDLFSWFGWVIDTADRDVFSTIIESTFSMAETGVNISIYLIGVMALWLGIMKIGENGGAVQGIARVMSPFFRKLFPELPKNHPSMGAMVMNFSANMLGLDNAATPLGLKAMKQLQELNPKKDTASNAQIMFLVLNTSGLTIIPVSVMALRAANGAENPADIFIPILLATFFSTIVGMTAVAIKQKINLLNKTVFTYLGSALVVIALIIWYFSSLDPVQVSTQSALFANFILFFIIFIFVILALKNKINVYESFIDGAKDGFNVAISIIPYLVAMLVAIGIFRASGAMDYLEKGLASFVGFLGIDTSFVPAMPTAFMKPLSGSGARGMMVEAMNHHGVDSFVGRLASVFQGSTETTFYTLAVYYGAVNVSRTRYTVVCGLIADLAGVLAAIFISYIFFK